VQGGSGLLVGNRLVRAIQTESAAALVYWFGVSAKVVWKWRKRFGVCGKFATLGSKAAQLVASAAGARVTRGKQLSDEVCDARAERARQSGRRPPYQWAHAGGWTAAELVLLGTAPDWVVARRVGRTVGAVTVKRVRRKVAAFGRRQARP
jgi:hypothetical protein